MPNYMSAVRKAIESQYDSKCDIFEKKKIKDVKTKITTFKEVKVYQNQNCRVSFEDIYVANNSDTESVVQVKIKLFISPDITINPGSKIIVTKKGKKNTYINSGIPAVHDTHQEIILDDFKGWT
ncbi:MAG: hypothetical protein IKM97_05015 [Clostridia bacterium]|nr:hypothetical protein [Clostridia bacterium]